ncbi:tyrosine-type recombinase/integrase [Azospirillum doebereinerae]|uniref:site-specific integrase n=1 Tax=Azospirillum doebereinerae TaxID=92933 RepID=UPI001EE600B3|nr:site-specific integrase [Azospirillum doebereinerae]MCG5241353.1 site-specific integrase [Azospirillum doebereinerae]
MASVRKRVLPSGETRWLVDYKDQNGKRRAKQFETRKAAVAFETKARGEVAQGVHVPDSASATVEQAADLWIKDGEINGLEATTIKQRREHVTLHIIPLIGAVKLSTLTPPRVEAFRDDLLKTRSRPLARAVLTSLKGVLRLARRKALIVINPAEDVKVDKRRAEGWEQDEGEHGPIPSKEHIRALLTKAPAVFPLSRLTHGRWVAGQGRPERIVPVPWRPLIVTATFTGMRASELRGLRWAHVDLKAGLIRVRERADRYQQIGPPKSKAGRRTIPLAPMVITTLREWRLVCPKAEMDLVFPTEAGGVILHTNLLRQGYYPLMRACGLMADGATEPPYPFHSLRHAAASLFIEQGWGPKKIQTVMGHSSIQVTFDIYGHLFPSPDDDRAAMEMLQARLLGG